MSNAKLVRQPNHETSKAVRAWQAEKARRANRAAERQLERVRKQREEQRRGGRQIGGGLSSLGRIDAARNSTLVALGC